LAADQRARHLDPPSARRARRDRHPAVDEVPDAALVDEDEDAEEHGRRGGLEDQALGEAAADRAGDRGQQVDGAVHDVADRTADADEGLGEGDAGEDG
jgi:hypothetical protein